MVPPWGNEVGVEHDEVGVQHVEVGVEHVEVVVEHVELDDVVSTDDASCDDGSLDVEVEEPP
jgi:hypothetical protein